MILGQQQFYLCDWPIGIYKMPPSRRKKRMMNGDRTNRKFVHLQKISFPKDTHSQRAHKMRNKTQKPLSFLFAYIYRNGGHFKAIKGFVIIIFVLLFLVLLLLPYSMPFRRVEIRDGNCKLHTNGLCNSNNNKNNKKEIM